MIDELMLLSGNDIPFVGGQTQVHIPTLKEIGYLTEFNFFTACEVLTLQKSQLELSAEMRQMLERCTDFDVILSVLCEQSPHALQTQTAVLSLLELMFPNTHINIIDRGIIITNEQQTVIISNGNYPEFKDILMKAFCLEVFTSASEYKPAGARAQAIMDKINAGKRKRAQLNKSQSTKIAILSRYASILAVGTNTSLNQLMDYTVYQLFDEFRRFEAKQAYDMYIAAKMQGAKDLEEVESWLRDLYEDIDPLQESSGNFVIQ